MLDNYIDLSTSTNLLTIFASNCSKCVYMNDISLVILFSIKPISHLPFRDLEGKKIENRSFWSNKLYLVRIRLHFRVDAPANVQICVAHLSSINHSFSIISKFNRLPLYQLSMQCVFTHFRSA